MERFDETWEYDPELGAELDEAFGAELEFDPEFGAELELDPEFGAELELDPEFGAELELDDAFGAELGAELGGALDPFEAFAETDGGEHDAGSDPEALYRSLIAEESRVRQWPDSVWDLPGALVPQDVGLLFPDPEDAWDLAREIRITELWERSQRGVLVMKEFLELAALAAQVDGVPGDACGDCAVLERPPTPDSWPLGATGLCRSHLRFRLGHARIDRST
jgi:hypothetical protein